MTDKGSIIIPHDKQYFEQLFAEYYSEMLSFAQHILFCEDEAKDAVQDAFLDIWKQEKDIVVKSSIRALLLTYVKKRALNRIQHLNIVDKHELQVKEAYIATYSHQSHERGINKEIQNILDSLPQQMRKIVEYRYLCDWSCNDIAEVLDIKASTVKTQISRALKKFRAESTLVRNYNLPSLFVLCAHFFF
ncbi:MAG: sigma-70 family RNA polymerase sigma factor [Mangrovibacterium sp.]